MASSEWEDSTYSSGTEYDSDQDTMTITDCTEDRSEDCDDPDKLLGTWLGELDAINLGFENAEVAKLRSSSKLTIPTPRMDTYRFSMANMEDSQDVELDAILGELCALETGFEKEMALPKSQSANYGLNHGVWKQPAKPSAGITNGHCREPYQRGHGHCRSNSNGGAGLIITKPRLELGMLHADHYADDYGRLQKPDYCGMGPRTDSPDNDSAFSDNVSMLSSESSASSGGIPNGDVLCRSVSSQSSSASLASSPTQAEQAARIKAEKIKIALEKMKEASIKKLFIKAFTADNSAKSLLIDERMTVGQVCRLLAEKNHVRMDAKWGLVEHIPELYMERVYEDHEHLVENLLLWTRDSYNQLLFLEREDKYDLFRNPQEYLLGGSSSERDVMLDDEAKATLLEEFFSSSGFGVPEVEGPLYLKCDGKKAWKKQYFVLRASGLYYCPKGRSKLSKDLLCLTTFEMNNVFFGFGWRKKYKAPTDFGFAIKHPQIQTKSSKYIKYLCADDEASLNKWVMGIRIAKYRYQLKENYDILQRDIEEEDLDSLAHARSFSISSMSKSLMVSSDSSDSPTSPKDAKLYMAPENYELPTTIERLNKGRVLKRGDSLKSSNSNKSTASSSSGCLSERSSSGTPTADQMAFEADFPVGTIKRKPAATPKIPLTNTTRNIAKQSVEDPNSIDNVSTNGSTSSGNSLCGSLSRANGGRLSLRRSKTDERIAFGSLSRKMAKQGLTSHQISHTSMLVDDLPLPPPPPEISGSTEGFNFDTLPPPPPEAFRTSEMDLDNLPQFPPPPPLEMSPEHCASNNLFSPSSTTASSSPETESSSSLSPLSPTNRKLNYPEIPPKPRKGVQRRQSENDAYMRSPPLKIASNYPESFVIKPKASKHKLNLDLATTNGENDVAGNSAHSSHPQCLSSQSNVWNRRTSAPCANPSKLVVVHSVFLPTSPTPQSPNPTSSDRQSRSQHKPTPPKRSENTKLSSTVFTAPQRRSASASAAPYDENVNPPESFLRDLQKVMVKKWKLAQLLTTETVSTPTHPILGFRDPGDLMKQHHKHKSQRSPSSPPPLPNHAENVSHHHRHHHKHAEKNGAQHKKPPPPLPKRNNETH